MNRCVASCTVESKKRCFFCGCAPAGAKALDEIGFAQMGAVDRSYRCAPLLNAPKVQYWTRSAARAAPAAPSDCIIIRTPESSTFYFIHRRSLYHPKHSICLLIAKLIYIYIDINDNT